MPDQAIVRNIYGDFPRLFGCWMSSLFDHKGHERRSVLVPMAVGRILQPNGVRHRGYARSMQVTARKKMWVLDNVTISTAVMQFNPDGAEKQPEDGAFVHGM